MSFGNATFLLRAGDKRYALRLHRGNYHQKTDNMRCEMAMHYLQQKQLPISEMALLLGYSEVSAFSRAFRRWFGISPRQWRQDGVVNVSAQN